MMVTLMFSNPNLKQLHAVGTFIRMRSPLMTPGGLETDFLKNFYSIKSCSIYLPQQKTAAIVS